MTTTEELIRILEGEDEVEFESEELNLNIPQGEGEFNWLEEAPSAPVIEQFDDFLSGISPTVQLEGLSELEFYEHFVNQQLMEHIANYTNKYHQHIIRSIPLKDYSRLHRWTDISVQEIYLFLSVTMLMTRNSHLTIEEHWSVDPLLSSPIFGKLMSRNRFCMILGMLCFFDISAPDTTCDSRLTKIDFLVQHARNVFKTTLTPYKNVCIDESIVPFKGRLIFKQYLPRKRNRFGIKLFVLCDCQTGFIVDFIIYCGATTDAADIPELGKSGSVVVKLLEDYFYCNRCLFVDNWYSSPALFMYLKEKQTYACGTVKVSRRGMPKFKKIKKGEINVYHSGPLMALKWKDKKDVTVLSTMHDSTILPSNKIDYSTGLPKIKPECVIDYTKNMGLVDKTDMMMSSLTIMRKTVKWHKKLSFHIFDMHLLNSLFLYNELNSTKMNLAQFQLNLIRQMIEKYRPTVNLMNTPHSSRSQTHTFLRLLPGDAAKHMPKFIPNGKSQRCKVCATNNIRSSTRFYCSECNIFLCVDPCSRIYHEKKNL